jgi:thiamine pyrophosphate-dependent acetolactate synthase large subunit-like protein
MSHQSAVCGWPISRGSGATGVVAALASCGVRTVFGIPGSHNLELYRAIHGTGIEHVSLRHEQGVGFAADGYARVSGRPGVCITTSGPGLTNVVTAIATAHADSVPVLLLAPGLPRGLVGRDVGWLHELRDQRMVMSGVVEHAVRVDSAQAAMDEIVSTFATWATRRPRPVYLEIPVDVLDGEWTGSVSPVTPPPVMAPPSQDIERATQLLAAACRPVIVAGGGANGASDVLTALAERVDAVVVTTINGKGVVAEQHLLSIGASLRLASGREVVDDADVVLAVGTELADTDLWKAVLAPRGRVIRVDIDDRQLQKNVTTELGLLGDARVVVSALLSALDEPRPGASDRDRDGQRRAATARDQIATETTRDGAPWAALHDELRARLPADLVIAGDSAQVSYYGTAHLWPAAGPRQFLYPTGYAPLGYGLPAAIGAKLAQPSRPVLVLMGDGGIQFTAMELTTAVERRLNLPVIIVNNGGYGQIRREMRERGIAPLGVDIAGPDWVRFAHACGAEGDRSDDPAGVAALAAAALTRDGPSVIEFVAGPAES